MHCLIRDLWVIKLGIKPLQFFFIYLFLVSTLSAEKIPAAAFLLPDGTLDPCAIENKQLTLDLSGWKVVLDPNCGPIFSPAFPPMEIWSALDMGLTNSVVALAVNGSDIYVGGGFTTVGSGGTVVSGLNRIAKWNGTVWSSLDSGLNLTVLSLAVSGTELYVGGQFTDVGFGGTPVPGLNHIAKWNGTSWSALDKGLDGRVDALVVSGTDVYAGGGFNGVGTGGTVVAGLNVIAKWNGIAWSSLDKGLNNSVLTIAFDGIDVYVGGDFTAVGAGGIAVVGLNRIAKWDGTAWSPLDKGLGFIVRALAVSGTDLYAGGEFSAVGSGGTVVAGLNKIAKWNGTAWSALDKGLNSVVRALAVSGTDLYVGGDFTGVGSGGTAVAGLNGIAKWNGIAWSPLDMGLNNLVRTLAVGGANVFAGAEFTGVGVGGAIVVGLNSIARWGPSCSDTENPEFTFCPNDTSLPCNNIVIDTSHLGVPLVTDDCSIPDSIDLTFRDDSIGFNGSCTNDTVGIITRTFFAMDEIGNIDSCKQMIAFIDTVGPKLFCPSDTTLDCGVDISHLFFVLQWNDDCYFSTDYGFRDDSIGFDGNCNHDTIGLVTRTYFVTDVCGNVDSCKQRIAFVDTLSPFFMYIPNDTMVSCVDEIPALVIPTVSDHCSSTRVYLLKDTIIDSVCVHQKKLLHIWVALDTCMNMIRDTQVIEIKDTIGPVFTWFPNDTTVECFDEVPSIPSTGMLQYLPGFRRADDNQNGAAMAPTAMDNCGIPTVSFTQQLVTDSSCVNHKSILRIWTASDLCNNMIRDTQIIYVKDTIAPLITCPDTNRTICEEGIPSAYMNLNSFLLGMGTVTDQCCIDSTSFILVSESAEIIGDSIFVHRQYAISDCCGLSDTCSQVLITPSCLLDLALKKEINAPVPFFIPPGGIVPFKITIYNQLLVPADSIKVIDYLPSPNSSVISPNWVNNGDGTACITLSRANGLLPVTGLIFGDSVTINFNVQLGLDLPATSAQNIAEIYSAQDTFHNTLQDQDSSPNGVPDDETGTIDNEVGDDGTLDEDDQDPAPFFILPSLVCNNKLNVSLGDGCQTCFTAADFLKGNLLPDEFYEIQLFDASGNKLQGNCAGSHYIGYNLIYKVILKVPNNETSCWGQIRIEDKSPPLLICNDTTIACYILPTLPLVPIPPDNCYPGKVDLISDEWHDYGCNSELLGYVLRTVQGSDRWGNFNRCTRTIYIRRTVIDNIICPDLVELPCEITYQIGSATKPFLNPLNLVTPITVDQNKITPAFLLNLQQSTWDLIDPITQVTSKGPVLNPAILVVPQIEDQNIWPGAGGICKINSLYRDTKIDICGLGFKIFREWIITDWCTLEEATCQQYIKVEDKEAPLILRDSIRITAYINEDDCIATINLPAFIAGTDYQDCNPVEQTYSIEYNDPIHLGKKVVLSGNLSAADLHLPHGQYVIEITLVDKCQNRSKAKRLINVHDITPPNPVCVEYTQVSVDPTSCWAKIAAKDLDNGSRDNCCNNLHFAVAYMDSIVYWRNYLNTKLEAEIGSEAFWKDKTNYEAIIEDWINCYVFSDSIHFNDCGSNQVVLRVYEACGIPKYDPHLFPCSPHAWYCYNTYLYIADFNFNWFDSNGLKSCHYRPELNSFIKLDAKYQDYKVKGYWEPKFTGSAQFEYCNDPFYYHGISGNEDIDALPSGNCSNRLHSDCMVEVLLNDKLAPVVAALKDVIVYCDQALESADRPDCGKRGEGTEAGRGYLYDSKGVEHGFYGGSSFMGIHYDNEHQSKSDTNAACGYDEKHNWAPIYCRSWLYIDSFDSAGKIDPKLYFDTLILFDKTRAARNLLDDEFSITDNCRLNDNTLRVTDEGSLNGCGEGWIQRTWTIRDKCDNQITVKQKVIVKHRSDFEVLFPEDKVIECDFLNTTDPRDAGEPIITDDDCEQVGVQYKDEVFTVEDSACYKIVRTWTLIDWCIYNPNSQYHYSDVIVDDRLRADTGNRSCIYRHIKDNNDGYMKYIQVIKVIDKIAPTVTARDTTICIYADDCKSSLARIPFNATDNCTATSELSFRVEVDLNATSTVFTNRSYVKSSIDQTTQSNQVEFVYTPSEAGKHVVHVIVKDNCGNEDTSSYRFELKDCKKPTPYCYNGIATVILPTTGKITVWAKDLNANSYDNCTTADNLKFSFTANVAQASKEFSCTDIPDGKSKTIPLDIWVTDEAGNQDHCSTYILLQDNSGSAGNACPDIAGVSVTIGGTIQTEIQEPVEHVKVNVYGRGLEMNYETSAKGTYYFESLPAKSNYTLKSKRNDQPMNGISTLDLVLIQKHILGVEFLNSPYKIIAADIDNDKQLTAIDLVELRKLILATYENLPNNESWRFVPKSTSFTDLKNPWNFTELMEMKNVTENYKSEDFIGIKVGDVNASASPHSLMGVEVRDQGTGLIFETNEQVFKAGDIVRVNLRSPNFRGISGWQGTLSAASSELRATSLLNGVELIPGNLDLKRENLGLRYLPEGMITMSWNTNAPAGIDLDDQQLLFTLVFKAQQDGRLSKVLRIGSQHTIAESYQGRGELGNLSIRFVHNGNEIVAKSELYQNYPNPFDQRTLIGIHLAQEGKGTLKIYDATGRTIRSIERNWTRGYHEVWFDRGELAATGVLYYRFESGFYNSSKKMVRVD